MIVFFAIFGYCVYRLEYLYHELRADVDQLYTYCHNMQAQITHGILVDAGPTTEIRYRKLDPTDTTMTDNDLVPIDDGSSVEVIDSKNSKNSEEIDNSDGSD